MAINECMRIDVFISFELINLLCLLDLLFHVCFDCGHQEFLLNFFLFEDLADEEGPMFYKTCASHS